MKKLFFTSSFFLLGIAAFSQSADQTKPQLTEAGKKDSAVSVTNNNTQLQETAPSSSSEKIQNRKSSAASNDSEKTPVLSESSVPKREE